MIHELDDITEIFLDAVMKFFHEVLLFLLIKTFSGSRETVFWQTLDQSSLNLLLYLKGQKTPSTRRRYCFGLIT